MIWSGFICDGFSAWCGFSTSRRLPEVSAMQVQSPKEGDLDSELVQLHHCCILLVKATDKASPDSRSEETDSTY